MYDTNRPPFLERDLLGLSVDSNWQVWARHRGGEPAPIHAVRKGATGLSNVESTTPSAFQMVNQVHGPTISVGGNGASDTGTRAGEGVGGAANGAGPTSGSIARSGASGGGSTVGTETGVDNELTKARGLAEGDRRGFSKKVPG